MPLAFPPIVPNFAGRLALAPGVRSGAFAALGASGDSGDLGAGGGGCSFSLFFLLPITPRPPFRFFGASSGFGCGGEGFDGEGAERAGPRRVSGSGSGSGSDSDAVTLPASVLVGFGEGLFVLSFRSWIGLGFDGVLASLESCYILDENAHHGSIS